jgi:hypothetical protein
MTLAGTFTHILSWQGFEVMPPARLILWIVAGNELSDRRNQPQFLFPLGGGVANGKWHISGHYLTQAKRRLEWGTQQLLPV